MSGYPRWMPSLLWLIMFGGLGSGLLLIPGALEMRLEWEVPWRLGGGLRLLTAAVHALGAFLVLLLLGALMPIHMRSGLRQRRNMVSGWLLVSLLAALAVSALGIYYLDETPGLWASSVHILLGLALTLPFALHAINGRRLARSHRRRPARRPH